MECKLCKKKYKHLENHHIIPVSRGGDNSKSNLIKICSKCHGLAHDVSFSSERGGLIKEAVKRAINENEKAKIWFIKNEHLVIEKMDKLFEENEDYYMLMLLLLEFNKITLSHLMEWVIKGKFRMKTSLTFPKTCIYNSTANQTIKL